ncbi:MAG: hypothetical protein DRK00_09565 [Thermoprotei archaeon]|nr:MAG: hypothetical protein DRK00_09565 [Thermoprotei archaeon]
MSEKYVSTTVKAVLYREALRVTGASNLPEALKRLVPRYVRGHVEGGHIYVKARVRSLAIEGVTYIDLGSLQVRLDEYAELLSGLFSIHPIIGTLGLILTIHEISGGRVKLLPKAESVGMRFEDSFLVDTGASKTLLNASRMPPDVQKIVAVAIKSVPVQTATRIECLAKGFATIELGGRMIEDEPVLIMSAPQEWTHILGVNTLRRILGDKILLDFRKGQVGWFLES